ncbi:MAG: maleylpyruvate isomerase N-terminal domain-containing protein, partial [Kutzneria sp.]|nr:maleylpyruvate isomerase N-terminal domain-containing protein [Kutzneria sp.]
MDHLDFVAALREQGTALRASAALAGPDAHVPNCPEWTVKSLVHHVAGVYAFATAAVAGGDRDQAPERSTQPEEWTALLACFDDRFGALTELLADTDPQTSAWTFPGAPRTVAFWSRRQAHETSIHRLDA